MINKNNLDVAGRVHASLMGKGILVKPVVNTLLNTLVTESIPTTGVAEGADLETTLLSGVTQQVSQTVSVESHDLTLDEATDVLIPGLINQINFARNEVKASVSKVFADVQRAVESSEPTNLNVTSVYLSSAVNSQFTVQIYENFKEQALRQMVALRGAPALTVEQATELLKTGASAYDQELVEMLASKPDGWCLEVYNRYIASPQVAGLTPAVGYAICDELLAAVIMYNNLMENIPEGIDMPLIEYRAAVSVNAAALSTALGVSVDIYWDAVRGKRLVEFCPQVPHYTTSADLNVRVFGPVMEQFLADGGTPEAVMGVAIQVSGIGFGNLDVDYLLDNITPNKEALVEVYNHWWAEAQKGHRTHLAAIIKDAVTPALCGEVLSIPEDKRAEGMTDEALVTAVKSELSKVTEEQFTADTYGVIQRTLCSTAYGHTSAGAILNGLDAYAKKYPDLDAREDGYLSVRDFLINWALSMVEVVRA